MEVKEILRGGQFLVKESEYDSVFTPEDFSEEQQMMKEAVKEFNERKSLRNATDLRPRTMRLPKQSCTKLVKWVFLVFLFLRPTEA